MNKFYSRSNITDKDNPINITYGELLEKSSSELDKWIINLRTYVIKQWDENGQPPVIGQNKKEMISNWKKLLISKIKKIKKSDEYLSDWYEINEKNINKFQKEYDEFLFLILKELKTQRRTNEA